MSERLIHSPEQQHSPESLNEQQDNLQELEKRAHDSQNEHAEKIEHIRAKIEKEADSHEYDERQLANEQQPSHHYITKRIKKQQYKQTLGEVQSQLPKAERRFSKVIHQPAIEAISEFSSKTIARPKPIIGGALIALVGSLSVLLIARHVGFSVPNSIFIILFVGGYLLAVIVELFIGGAKKLLPKNRRNN